MSGFVEGIDRSQSTLFPVMLDHYVAEDNLVRAVTLSLKALILATLALVGLRRWKKVVPAIIRQRCSSLFADETV